jgi:hypothetical protein
MKLLYLPLPPNAGRSVQAFIGMGQRQEKCKGLNEEEDEGKYKRNWVEWGKGCRQEGIGDKQDCDQERHSP